jgi:hypothetical protein
MIIFLLTLLAVALTVTFAGLLLSPRSPESPPRRVSYAGRSSGVRRVNVNRQMRQVRVRRPLDMVERGTWANMVAALDVRSIFGVRTGEQTPWLGLVLILLALFISGTLLLRNLLPGSAVILAPSWPDAAVSAPAPARPKSPAPAFSGTASASQALVRINQLSPDQYVSSQQYDTWAYSTCSAASMTEVINSYGHHYRIADILQVEAGLHEITPELGLLEPVGIDRTVAQFNFKATWLNNPSLDRVIAIANQGRPVIVGFPPQRWSGGHILVVRGGNSNEVYTADSSRLNIQTFTRQNFMKYWAGFAVVVTPK